MVLSVRAGRKNKQTIFQHFSSVIKASVSIYLKINILHNSPMSISHEIHQTNHDLAQEVQISSDKDVKWSGYFPFLFINRLNITWTDKLTFVKRSGSAVCLSLSNQMTSLGKCMLNDYKSTAQNIYTLCTI